MRLFACLDEFIRCTNAHTEIWHEWRTQSQLRQITLCWTVNTHTHMLRLSRLNQIKWRKTWQIVQQQTETNLALIWMCKIEINVEQSHTHWMHKMHNAHQWTWTSIRTSMAKRCECYVCHKLCARLRQTTRFIKLKNVYCCSCVEQEDGNVHEFR